MLYFKKAELVALAKFYEIKEDVEVLCQLDENISAKDLLKVLPMNLSKLELMGGEAHREFWELLSDDLVTKVSNKLNNVSGDLVEGMETGYLAKWFHPASPAGYFKMALDATNIGDAIEFLIYALLSLNKGIDLLKEPCNVEIDEINDYLFLCMMNYSK